MENFLTFTGFTQFEYEYFNLKKTELVVAKEYIYVYFFLLNCDDYLTLKVMTVLLIAGCAAASAIGYVGQFGEEHVGWQPICDHVQKFCKTNLVSLLLSYFAFITYFGLTILSAYKCVSSSPKN